jgi:hypothetical protein
MQNAKELYNFVQINSKVGISNNKTCKVKNTYSKGKVHLNNGGKVEPLKLTFLVKLTYNLSR